MKDGNNMKYYKLTKAIRLDYRAISQLQTALDTLVQVDKELEELVKEDDYFFTLEDDCTSAIGALNDFLNTNRRYETGED